MLVIILTDAQARFRPRQPPVRVVRPILGPRWAVLSVTDLTGICTPSYDGVW